MTRHPESYRHARQAARLTVTALPCLLALLLLAGCGGTAPETTETAGDSSRPMAAGFSLTDLDGTTHRLADYRGKVVVLNFWDTWCGPCRQEIPTFIAMQQEMEAKGLQLLGVALGQEGVEKVRDYTSRSGINYPVLLLGGNNDLLTSYGGIRSIPATFIIDREGRLAAEHIGYLSRGAFEQMVRPVLAEGAPS